MRIEYSPFSCLKHFNVHLIDKKHSDNNFGSVYNVLCSQTLSACVQLCLNGIESSVAGACGRRRRQASGATRRWRRGAPRRPFGTRRSSDPSVVWCGQPRTIACPRYRCRAAPALRTSYYRQKTITIIKDHNTRISPASSLIHSIR